MLHSTGNFCCLDVGMINRFAALLLVSMTALAGCGREAEGQLPTPAQISAELLTITDLNGDWSESQRQIFEKRENENPSIDPSIWCAEAEEVTKNLVQLAGDSGADVEMQYRKTTEGNRMMRLQAWANEDTKDYFRDAKEAVRICDGKNTTDENGATTSTEVIDNRDIGDESISWAQKTIPPAGTEKDKLESVGRTTIARFGDIVMVLQLGDASFAGTAELMNENDWWSIVELASKKLDKLDEQVHN